MDEELYYRIREEVAVSMHEYAIMVEEGEMTHLTLAHISQGVNLVMSLITEYLSETEGA